MFLLEIEYKKMKCKMNNFNVILFCDKKQFIVILNSVIKKCMC